MAINKHVQQHIVKPNNALWLSVLDDQGYCEMVRIEGINISNDNHLLLHIPKMFEESILRNVEDRTSLSVLAASILDHESYQLKGNYVSHQEYQDELNDFRIQYKKDIHELLGTLNIDATAMFAFMNGTEGTTITMKVDKVFEQTPKVGAGKLIQ